MRKLLEIKEKVVFIFDQEKIKYESKDYLDIIKNIKNK